MKRLKMNRAEPMPKRNGLSNLVKFATYGTLGLGAASSFGETVITFEGFTTDNIDIQGIPGYGDNVSSGSADWTVRAGRTGVVGTPGITIDWLGSGWQTYTAWDGRGNVAQTDFNAASVLSLVFTPSEFSAVHLNSFQLDEWAGGGAGVIEWTIGSARGVLASGSWDMTDAGGRKTVTPSFTGLLGETLSLDFTLGSGLPSYFALDNLTFDQVPEPSTWALGALGAAGLGAAAMRRRRRA